ncbi:acetyltransferase, ribosomal protein N-acetylase [Leptolyngbya sp. PCC 7375]|nr:acetyltransferase, ribosomal protein N-acetylase [Leptolyngbya sp. PCC 7375]
MQPINTARLKIREFIFADADAFISFMTDPESTKFLTFTNEQTTREGAKSLIEFTIDSYGSEQPMLAFAVEEKDSKRFVGFCGLNPHDDETVEVMYAVMPEARGRGYGAEIAIAISHHALNDLGYHRVVAPIAPENKYSQVVATKAGFKDCGIVKQTNFPELVRQFVLQREMINDAD